MAYFASVTNLNNRYGPTNVALMSDVDGTNNAVAIAARQADALLNADSWVYGFLRKSRYSQCLPTIVDRNGNVPRELTMCATWYAGYDLLRASGFRDFDKDGKPLNRLYADFMEAEKMMTLIAREEIFLLDVEH